MINWTEEDVKFVYENMLKPVMEEAAKATAEGIARSTKITDKMFSAIADTIQELRYEMMRDRRFFLGFISEYTHLDKESLYDGYKKWCEEFDKLNNKGQTDA